MGISEQSKQAITEFLQEWWESLRWQASQSVAGAELRPMTKEDLYGHLLGLNLQEIAAAAEGLLPDDPDTRATVYEGVQTLCEWMWARPGMPNIYSIPWDKWSATPMGWIVLRALVWAQDDQLLTITEAARKIGRTIDSVSQAVKRGALPAYTDPTEINPRRSRRVRLSEAKRWAGVK